MRFPFLNVVYDTAARCLPFLFIVLLSLSAEATHNRGGEITYVRIAPFTTVAAGVTKPVYTYSIIVTRYTDHDGGNVVADRCVDTVWFGDGQKGVAQRVNNGVSQCNCSGPCGELIHNVSGYVIKKNIYTITHAYSGPGHFLIRSSDPNRNPDVINIPGSAFLPLYIESLLVINTDGDAGSSPVLKETASAVAVVSSCFSFNACAHDPDGDSLSYEITSCRAFNGSAAPGYAHPPGNYAIQPSTGLLTWCAPSQAGEYNIAFIINKWRRKSCGSPQLMGRVLRDMQVIVKSSLVPTPTVLTSFSTTCVDAGQAFSLSLSVPHPSVVVALHGSAAAATVAPVISAANSSSNTIVTLNWATDCGLAQRSGYHAHIAATVQASPPRNLHMTIPVRVLPQPPVIYNVTVDTSAVTLKWNTSGCQAKNYNIYRKFGSTAWIPGPCEANAAASGFAKIGQVTGTDSSYTDHDLWLIPHGSTGNYFVTAELDDCSESRADSVITVSLIVGLEETGSLGTLSVSPNPMTDVLHFSSPSFLEDAQVQIFDGRGKIVTHHELNWAARTGQISMQHLAPGVYYLRVTAADGSTQTRKVLKQ